MGPHFKSTFVPGPNKMGRIITEADVIAAVDIESLLNQVAQSVPKYEGTGVHGLANTGKIWDQILHEILHQV